MEQQQQHQMQREISFRRDRRGPCDWILNFLWLIIGGWHMFLTWAVTGLVLCATIVGIPCGWQVLKISFFLLFPFGKSLTYTHEELQDEGSQCCLRSCNCFLNILWAITVGWVLAIQALGTGILLMLTIVGIPFGWQCFKLTYLCFCPFGVDFTAEERETVTVMHTTTTTTHQTNYQAMEYGGV